MEARIIQGFMGMVFVAEANGNMGYSLNSLERGLYRGVLQGLIRGTLEV